MQADVSKDLPFELQALYHAIRYQQWIMKAIKPYLGNRILELGAGIGNMSQWFHFAEHFVITESDRELLILLEKRMKTTTLDLHKLIIKQHDITQDFSCFSSDNIDTIVSFNVLEHIEDDVNVLKNCVNLLRHNKSTTTKRIISFVPAHQWAYGNMDKELGHFRRYNKNMFKKLHEQTAPDTKLILKYFNFVGLWGWMLNGRVLKRPSAGTGLIKLFEQLCPAIQWCDKLLIDKLKLPFGQSLIAIQEFKDAKKT